MKNLSSVAVGLLLFCAGTLLVACSDNSSWTTEGRVNAQGVPYAMASLTAGTRIENELGFGRNNYSVLLPIIANLRTALDHARSVEDNVLDKIHPHLKIHWRDELEKGLEMRLKNLESTTGDPTAEIEGAAKLDRFGTWWNTNRTELRIPKLR